MASDSTSRTANEPTPGPVGLIGILAAVFAAFSIIEVNFLFFAPWEQRAIFLAFPLALAFFIPRYSKPEPPSKLSRILDYVLGLAGAATCAYVVYEYDGLIQRMGTPTQTDLIIGAAGAILVLVATRKLVGWALPLIALFFLVYAYAGDALPTSLGGHAGYGINRIITQSFLTMEGVFGIPIQVMFQYVFPFVLFGVVLESIGGLAFAIDLAEALLGRYRGGPAKVAVVSSAVFGMVNGSAVANVVTAGSFTIPMMKKTGVQAHVAAAVEAVASTGGQLMPPVMGAAAFMMVEFLGIPYLEIVTAALIPAILYYLALFTTIHFYAVRHNLGGAGRQYEPVARILRRPEFVLFIVPFGVLVGSLVAGSTTTRSVSWAIVAACFSSLLTGPRRVGFASVGVLLFLLYRSDLVVISPNRAFWLGIAAFVATWFLPEQRLKPRPALNVLVTAGKNSVSLCAATACVGIVIGLILMTALGSRFTPMVLELSAGNIYIALVLVMFSSVVLGMGLPTTVCYILLATLAAPALVNMGIEPLAAHMFILYFGMMSMVTPPSALAAYAGAMIAGSDIMRTGFTAWMFSLSGYLLPFMFALNPALLMIGSTGDILIATATGTVGVVALGAAVAGHIRMRLLWVERASLFGAAVVLIHAGLVTDLIGALLLAPVIIRHYRPFRQRPPAAA